MTIKEAITRTDELMPNTYSEKQKLRWLSNLESKIIQNIWQTHWHMVAEDATAPEDPADGQLWKNPEDDKLYMYRSEKQDWVEETRLKNFAGYTAGPDNDTLLLVPFPHDEIYVHWLETQIAYANEEYDKYNNCNMMFRSVYQEYSNKFNQTHDPLSQKNIYF